MTARVRGVRAAEIASGRNVEGRLIGLVRAPAGHPRRKTASQVAMYVLDGTSTSSPAPIPSAVRQRRSASSPLPTPTQPVTPMKAANSCSNAVHSGPRMYRPCARTASMRLVTRRRDLLEGGGHIEERDPRSHLLILGPRPPWRRQTPNNPGSSPTRRNAPRPRRDTPSPRRSSSTLSRSWMGRGARSRSD